MSRTLAATSLAVGLLVAPQAHAQAPNPDAIPDKMPFATPAGTPISSDRADAVIQAGVAEAKKRAWAMNIAVVTTSGELKAFTRMDGAQLASVSIAQHKARVAARYRRPTKALEEAVQKGATFLLTLDDVIASRGGIPLIDNGKIIGAVGCSGGTGSQDEAVCTAAAAVVNK